MAHERAPFHSASSSVLFVPNVLVSGRMRSVTAGRGVGPTPVYRAAVTSWLPTKGSRPHMSLLLRWWSHPADYAWTTAYHRTNPFLRHAHIAVGAWCWLYAALCILCVHTPAGIVAVHGQLFAYVLAGCLAVLGAWWMCGPFPGETVSRVFVGFLELSAAMALLLLTDPFVALACAAGFGVIGSYIAAFHSPKLFLVHQVWALAIVVSLFVRAIAMPEADVVLACVYLIVLTLVLFSAPILTHALLLLLRRDAATAFYDPLTGLRNRRGLDAAIVERRAHRRPVTVMVIDLDEFKLVNDRFGHAHGDVVLRRTADAIHSAFLPPAITARTGGEEFAVVTFTELEQAADRADALRQWCAAQADLGATVSIGVTHHPGSGSPTTGLEQALGRADIAMYAAKRTGGNSVFVHNESSTPPIM